MVSESTVKSCSSPVPLLFDPIYLFVTCTTPDNMINQINQQQETPIPGITH